MTETFTTTFESVKREIVTPLSLSLPGERGVYVEFRALWDTGAVVSCISLSAAERLGMKKQDDARIAGADNNPFSAPVFCVCIRMDSYIIPYHTVVGLPMDGLGHDVIVGMDIISRGDFSIINSRGGTVMSFTVEDRKG